MQVYSSRAIGNRAYRLSQCMYTHPEYRQTTTYIDYKAVDAFLGLYRMLPRVR
nr:MAG TPA: hypothetical protein [Caudoviricetes sp.]